MWVWVGLKKELQEARKKRRIYVNNFCTEYGVSTSHFYQVINGKRNPGEKLKKEDLAEFLGISVEHIDRLVSEGRESDLDAEVESISNTNTNTNTNTNNEVDVKIANKFNKKLVLYAALLLALVSILIFSTIYFYPDKDEISIEPTQKHPKVSDDHSGFVKDVTIPDGEMVLSNRTFKKIWRIKNKGLVPWKGRFLTRINPSDGEDECASTKMVPIKDTEPGEEVDVVAYIKPHSKFGTCKTYWKITDKDGIPFFPNLSPFFSIFTVTPYKNRVYMAIYDDMGK